jgi:myo-inositol-1(or 4)-monophosphatase
LNGLKKMSNRYMAVAVEAALKSGLFIKNSVGKVRKISYKGRINIVTDVDRTAEGMIIKKILSSFPRHSVLSEEAGQTGWPSRYRWIIDPLDGTTNFAHSFPFFSVSIALEDDGRVILGVVYDPMRDELFTAECGKGARLNNKRIEVSAARRLSESFLATGFAYDVKRARNTNIGNFRNFLMRAQAIRRAGSAALDLCYVACGRFDGFWELNLYPWDSAAGSLIITEAKGRVTRFDGSEYSLYDKDILSSNGLIHRQMVKLLSEK